MSREWLAVYTALIAKPKYRRLTPIGRGALLHVWILAGYQTPEATWATCDELRDALRLDGFPDGSFDELLGLGWLDRDEGDGVSVHDWDVHQVAASAAIGRAWEAAKMKEWRRQKRPASPPHPLSLKEDNNTQHNKGYDMSRHVPTPGGDEVVGEYERLFGNASEKKVAYLSSIASRWPVERILEGLGKEKELGATVKNICGRLEAGLARGDGARA